MDDRDFFDMLYQGWSKTTGAENTFWAPEEDEYGLWPVYAVAQDQTRTVIGEFVNEADAAFITALHGCFADLTRRLHSALDEADRLDEQKDDLTVELANLAIDNVELQRKLDAVEEVLRKMDQDLISAQARVVELEFELHEVGR